jgi:hypothetical protein
MSTTTNRGSTSRRGSRQLFRLDIQFSESVVTQKELLRLFWQMGGRLHRLVSDLTDDGYAWQLEAWCRGHRDIATIIRTMDRLPGVAVVDCREIQDARCNATRRCRNLP